MAASPNEDEAAAIAAAVERFVADVSPAAGEHRPGASPWQRAALLEGVSAKGGVADREGGEGWLS
jgi:hypothetical protein